MSTTPPGRLFRWTARERATSLSEEFRYLESFIRRQIDVALPGFEVVDSPPPPTGADPDLVLRLSSERVMFTAATLQTMAGAVADGADVAASIALGECGDPAAANVYTLAGFESIEARALARSAAVAPGVQSCPPLSLWRVPAFRRAAADCVEVDLPADARVARCGLFYEFIDYYGEVRRDVLPYIPEHSQDILEVGCARGLTGELIQQTLGCRVTGIDLNPAAAAEAATRLHAAHCGDVEELDLAGSFDAVVALELFEHLRDPMRFVTRMLEFLRPGGRLVMSTPNVGHYAIVRDLVAGRWDYIPIGLLCYTHLRFFTRATLADWLAMAGCTRVEIVAQRTELPEDVVQWARGVPGADLESLATKGFWVIAGR